jgi:hypothetical protein
VTASFREGVFDYQTSICARASTRYLRTKPRQISEVRLSIKALLVDVDGVLVDGRPEDGLHWQTSLNEDLGFTADALHQELLLLLCANKEYLEIGFSYREVGMAPGIPSPVRISASKLLSANAVRS